MSAHLPRHRLEQLCADHPRSPLPPACFVHVRECDDCSVQRRALEAARARYLAVHSATEFARTVALRLAEPQPKKKRGLALLRAWLRR